MRFESRFGGIAIGFVLGAALFAALALFLMIAIRGSALPARLVAVPAVGLVGMLGQLLLFLWPMRYALTSDGLEIRQGVGRLLVPYEEILHVRRGNWLQMLPYRRGLATLAFTGLILERRRNTPLMISPADAEGFVAALAEMTPLRGHRSGRPAVASPRRRGRRVRRGGRAGSRR